MKSYIIRMSKKPSLLAVAAVLTVAATALILSYTPNMAYAERLSANECIPNPEIPPLVIPPKQFPLTNNLRRKSASPLLAEGVPIYIDGVVLDENCVPIPGVIVKIWHADSFGTYPHLVPGREANPFAGAGTAYTDNLGRFRFVSILPGRTDGEPIVFFQVEHDDFGILHTAYHLIGESLDAFSGSVIEDKDYDIPEHTRSGDIPVATATPIDPYQPLLGTRYEMDITLKGVIPNRGY